MRQLVLHLGAPKTGSSLLQKMLNANHEKLFSLGYSTFVRHTFEETTGRLHAQWRRGNGSFKRVERAIERLRDAVSNESLVISHEDLLGPINSFFSGKLYPNAEQVIKSFLEAFRPEQLAVILYVRRQDRFLESSYLQTVRMGASKSFEEFCKDVDTQALRWDDLVFRIEKVLPDSASFQINYFESINKLGGRQFCQKFANSIDSRFVPSLSFNTNAQNRGYSDIALRIARAVNEDLSSTDRKTLRSFLEKEFSTLTHPKPTLLPADRRGQMLAELEPSNMALHERIANDGSVSPYVTTVER